MKKLFITVLMIVLCFSSYNVFADDFKVVADSKSAGSGDIVEINISLENNPGIIAALFSVEYDRERLELMEVTDGRILDGGTFSPNYKSYPYKMVWNSAAFSDFTDDGVLAVLKFKVTENAKSGKAFINLTYKENDIFNVDLNNVPVTVVNGSIDIAGKKQSGGSGGSSGTRRPSIIASNPAVSSVKEQIILTIGEKEATVFGETKVNDVAPVIRNDRTMLPARFVAENLGALVEWDNDTRKVTITKDDITIIITIDSSTALVNGAAIVLDSPAFIENDRTYTPLRFIAEKLGAVVEWNEDLQKVTITKK